MLFGVFDDQFQLAEFFDDGNDVFADLGGEDDRFDELVILESIADDRGLVVVNQRHHGQ